MEKKITFGDYMKSYQRMALLEQMTSNFELDERLELRKKFKKYGVKLKNVPKAISNMKNRNYLFLSYDNEFRFTNSIKQTPPVKRRDLVIYDLTEEIRLNLRGKPVVIPMVNYHDLSERMIFGIRQKTISLYEIMRVKKTA